MNLTDATILVVDDEPALLEIFSKWLVAVGCRSVLTAPNGAAALDLLQHESIDLLLTDLRMPVMDGLTLVRRLTESGHALPSIVFVSGFGDVDQREMYSLGVEAFIAKPFDRNDLLAVLQKAVADRSTLWHTQMPTPPRQSLLIHAKRIAESASPDTIGLGRGGFTVCSPASISPGRLAFKILLSHPPSEITGQGNVRWCSRPDSKVGIELAYLAPECCATLAEAITAAAPRSFIPGS